jgi:hypothetical protein
VEAGAVHAQNPPQEEIGLRLLKIPAFQAFARKIGEQVLEDMMQEMGR